ncbi:MAG: bifunctional DNA-formamidopyrimidine glycosylase/DNA-(apurinic or apyrimidinic site) lyase [Propionibacteriaceae bacterium]|nr:bifunctional DNA-formamidopyrimidine glycosylase/DNA-(apurinic or apyrimidinic site) lyase [Propionibacteriaceae bacterium]
MPELPEVETVRRGLARLVVGRQVAGVDVLNPGSYAATSDLTGLTFTQARRRAKMLLLDVDDGHTLAVHLKMTGQLVCRGVDDWGGGHPSDSLIGDLPDRSTRVIIDLDDGSRLFFNDQRKFGWMRLVTQADAETMTAGLGPEPMDDDAWPLFRQRVRHHQRSLIKAALLDQTIVAGIGNIYADEALWAARVHPSTRVQALSDRALHKILDAAADVMTLSIDLGGSTARNYVDAEGRRGAYLDFAQVFRREGQPCNRCGTTLIKTRVAGRGTHLCPRCQRVQKEH